MTATLWFAFFGGHLAWSAHLLVSYYLATHGCTVDPGEGAARWTLLHATTGVAALVTLAGAGAAGTAAGGPPAPQRFVARVALVLDVAFLAAIVAAGTANLFLPPCA
jgi:hypothetical protein